MHIIEIMLCHFISGYTHLTYFYSTQNFTIINWNSMCFYDIKKSFSLKPYLPVILLTKYKLKKLRNYKIHLYIKECL